MTNRLRLTPDRQELTMATLHEIATHRKPQGLTHYAYLGEVYGTAELLTGSGYLFRAAGERTTTLVSSRDPELLLLGRCALTDMQHDVDMLVGGYAAVCTSRDEGRA